MWTSQRLEPFVGKKTRPTKLIHRKPRLVWSFCQTPAKCNIPSLLVLSCLFFHSLLGRTYTMLFEKGQQHSLGLASNPSSFTSCLKTPRTLRLNGIQQVDTFWDFDLFSEPYPQQPSTTYGSRIAEDIRICSWISCDSDQKMVAVKELALFRFSFWLIIAVLLHPQPFWATKPLKLWVRSL